MARNQLPNDPGTPAPPPRRSTPPPTTPPQPQGPPNYPNYLPQVLNPPFDKRILSVGGSGPIGQMRPLKKGIIVSWPTSFQPIKHQVNFLFNPSVLNTQFAMNVADPATGLDPSKQDPNGPAPVLASEGQITLDLLFDRTYEVWDRAADPSAQTAASTFGVHIDVLAFYAFCQMIDMTDWQGVKGAVWEDLYPKRQLSYKAAFLYVGPNLKFFGYISGLGVQYSHWARDMTPTRCAISVNFTTQSFIKAGTNVAEAGAPDETDGGRWNGTGKNVDFWSVPGKGQAVPVPRR